MYEILQTGAENAMTSKELCDVLGLEKRQLTRRIEIERKAGNPICANTQHPQGYFKPKDVSEAEKYYRSLTHRIEEIKGTQDAVASWLSAARAAQSAAASGKRLMNTCMEELRKVRSGEGGEGENP